MRKTDFLLRDARLKEAKDWLKKHRDEIAPKEKEFIKKSIRRANWLRVGVFVMVLPFAIVAGWQWWESDKARKQAESMSWIYLAQQETLKGKPVNAILLVLEALPKNSSDPKRPVVTQAIETLYQALFNLHDHPLMHKEIIGVSDKYVASLGENGKIHLWERSDSQLVYMFGESTEDVNRVIFSSDGSKVLAYSKDTSSNNTVYIWNLANGQLLRKLSPSDWKMTFDDESISEADKFAKPPYTKVSYANFISKRNWVVIKLTKITRNVADTLVKLIHEEEYYSWNIDAQEPPVKCRSDKTDKTISCKIKSDSKTEVTKQDKTDKLLDDWRNNASSPLLIKQSNLPKESKDLRSPDDSKTVHSPDGKKTVTINGDNVTLRLENGKTQALKMANDEYDKAWVPSVTYATFSQDGKIVLTASKDNIVRLWNAQNGQLIKVLKGLTASINNATFIDNKIILVSEEHTVTVWDISSDESFNVKKFDNVRQINISPDGSQVITVSHDGTAKIWRLFLEPQTLVNFANKVVPRCLTSQQRKEFSLPESQSESLLANGEQLAKKGQIEAAMKQFEKAQALEPCLKLAPEHQARYIYANVLIEKGEKLAQHGKIHDAVVKFEQAQQVDSRVIFWDTPHPESKIYLGHPN